MLRNRRFDPSDEEILYHYCSPQTFLTICSTRRLRFSDLFSMNDFMEVHWGYHIWEQAAGSLIEEVGKDLLDAIDAVIHVSGVKALALASCMSRKGDVLSQWRAYGSDGTGYAIGFKASELVQLPVQPLCVEYNVENQVEELKAFIRAVHRVEMAEEVKQGPVFVQACARLAFDLTSFKNPAFAEEDEVRLIHMLNFEPSNNSLRLVDPGGTAFGEPAAPLDVGFHISSGTPVAHLDIPFTVDARSCPITEVVLGPKNNSMSSGISVMLETIGLANVRVRKSKASYR